MSTNAVKTTGDKIRELCAPGVLDRIDKAGLKVVDKNDFDTMVKQNNQLATENRTMRLRVRELELQTVRGDGQCFFRRKRDYWKRSIDSLRADV